MTHWPVLLFIAGLTKSVFSHEVAEGDPSVGALVRPYACQYLFECQSAHLVSSVLSGGRYDIEELSMKSSLDWFVVGFSIANSHATCLWSVEVEGVHAIEMLAKGLNYTLDNGEKERRVSLAKGQYPTPSKKERGRIVSLSVDFPGEIMPTLIPFTQHLTELTFKCKLPCNKESFFNGISSHNTMLEDLRLSCPLTPDELLPLVSNLPKLGKLARLSLPFGREFLADAKIKSLSVLEYLQSCPVLTELTLSTPTSQTLEMPSALLRSLQPLLVGKLKLLIVESFAFNSSAAKALSHPLQSQHCSLVALR